MRSRSDAALLVLSCPKQETVAVKDFNRRDEPRTIHAAESSAVAASAAEMDETLPPRTAELAPDGVPVEYSHPKSKIR